MAETQISLNFLISTALRSRSFKKLETVTITILQVENLELRGSD